MTKEKDFNYVGPDKSDKKDWTQPEVKDRWKTSRLFKWFGSLVETPAPSLSMPKYQRCAECQASSKRKSKIATGAYYHCRTHGDFFVRTSGG